MSFFEWLHSYGSWTHKGRAITNGAGLLFILGLCTILWMLLYPLYTKRKRIGRIKRILDRIEKQDSAWNRDALINYVYRDYFNFINRWCDQDLENIRSMSDVEFYEKYESKINELQRKGYKEEIKHITIKKKEIIDVYFGQEEREFTILFAGIAQFETIDACGNVIKKKPNNFEHFLTYRRSNNHWLLADFSEKYKAKNKRQLLRL